MRTLFSMEIPPLRLRTDSPVATRACPSWIAANPQKGLGRPQGLAGPVTFDTLYVGEKLNLPHSWGVGEVPTPAPPLSWVAVPDGPLGSATSFPTGPIVNSPTECAANWWRAVWNLNGVLWVCIWIGGEDPANAEQIQWFRFIGSLPTGPVPPGFGLPPIPGVPAACGTCCPWQAWNGQTATTHPLPPPRLPPGKLRV
jgi:hypothetical protein